MAIKPAHATVVSLIIALVLGTAAARAEDRSALAATNCTPSGELRGDTERGAMLHEKHCASCHGADGRAEVVVMHLETMPADQSDPAYMQTVSDDFLYVAVCKGGEGVGKSGAMPAWGDVLTDADIKALIAHMRSFSGT